MCLMADRRCSAPDDALLGMCRPAPQKDFSPIVPTSCLRRGVVELRLTSCDSLTRRMKAFSSVVLASSLGAAADCHPAGRQTNLAQGFKSMLLRQDRAGWEGNRESADPI